MVHNFSQKNTEYIKVCFFLQVMKIDMVLSMFIFYNSFLVLKIHAKFSIDMTSHTEHIRYLIIHKLFTYLQEDKTAMRIIIKYITPTIIRVTDSSHYVTLQK